MHRACISLESTTYGLSDLCVVLQSQVESNVAGDASLRIVDLYLGGRIVGIVPVAPRDENDWEQLRLVELFQSPALTYLGLEAQVRSPWRDCPWYSQPLCHLH